MYTTKLENLQVVIEKAREELHLLGNKGPLSNNQIIKKSKELDHLLNIYYNTHNSPNFFKAT